MKPISFSNEIQLEQFQIKDEPLKNTPLHIIFLFKLFSKKNRNKTLDW